MITPEQEDFVQQAVNALGEHFDSVLVLVSLREGGGTSSMTAGTGDCNSRYGMAKEYVIREEFRMVERVRREDQDKEQGDF